MSQASGNGDSDDQTNAGLPRRHVLRTVGAGALGLGLGGVALTAVTVPRGGAPQPQATSIPTPEGFGSVGQAPYLPAVFAKTFTGKPGENVAGTMKLVAHDVRSVVIPGTGHWVAEEAPQEVLAALTTFLAPYRNQGRSTRPQPAATLGK
ncbi:hypothetical protein SHIRM173S_05555 [Streptomyces hirsutus]